MINTDNINKKHYEKYKDREKRSKKKKLIIIGVLLAALIAGAVYAVYIYPDVHGHFTTVTTVYENN